MQGRPRRTETSVIRHILTPVTLLRLALAWGACLALALVRPWLETDPSNLVLWGALAAIVAVIVVSAFGVVGEAEHLAARLGDPYGTLVLTFSIVLIEVILISAVMLGPGDHATIARDSIMAVSMIIMNLVVGVALLVAGLSRRLRARRDDLRPNSPGVTGYLAVLVVLSVVAFALPGTIGVGGAYTAAQVVPIVLLTLGLYGFFLVRQMGAQKADFQEVVQAAGSAPAIASPASPAATVSTEAESVAEFGLRAEVIARTTLLVALMLPIVLLSHDLATLLDEGLDRVGAPISLTGLLIAMIVFLPETITTVRAAAGGEIQRVSNLCHGALVSTVGLTVPAVLMIGLLTGQQVTLLESPTNLVLLGVTMLLTVVSFLGRKVTAIHGAAHLAVFLIYCLTVFQ